jgi:outer membrane lipoprotein-sorting protein
VGIRGLRACVFVVLGLTSVVALSAAARSDRDSAAAPVAQASLDPREILDRVDDLYRGESSHGRFTMTVKTVHWERALEIEFWDKGKTQALFRILAPKKEAGSATLRSGNDLWNFLPRVNRVIKLPSSMMSASWMGSHFTNDDLVKETRMADDYRYRITAETTRGGRPIVELTCDAKPTAAVVWGQVVVTVDRGHYLPVEIRYFNENHSLARTLTFSDVTSLGGRQLPAVLTLVPNDKPGESTTIRYEQLEFNVHLDDGFFSLRTLQR